MKKLTNSEYQFELVITLEDATISEVATLGRTIYRDIKHYEKLLALSGTKEEESVRINVLQAILDQIDEQLFAARIARREYNKQFD
jgi:hypothetical protein